ncbi:hypothetical protein SARI_01227 [Salmonella enterica subsp. arizonae serovar 62:z4,z23:-]|nr:hypothetical protein SARI_01227 [Salmonella enterica subsp. arizonae serovar 62:z4,z23:-]
MSTRLKTEFFSNQRDRRNNMAEHRGGSGNFAENREKASEAGRKGGQHSGGNFKNDPQRASEAGKKGGQNSHGGRKSDNS